MGTDGEEFHMPQSEPAAPQSERKPSILQVIWWWERRRIRYNIVIGGLGLFCLAVYLVFLELAGGLGPGEDAVEPLMLIFAPFIVNILYTGGWITELVLRILWKETSPDIGRILYRSGISFSIFVVAFPAVCWFVIWVFSLV